MDMAELEKQLHRLEMSLHGTENAAGLQYDVLHGDDCASDRFLLRFALEESAYLRPLTDVFDGVEVIDFLSGSGKYADRSLFPFPQFLLLDMAMPRKNGMEVLAWLKKQQFSNFHIVVLSSSLSPANTQRALELGANYCHAKPQTTWQLRSLVRRLELLMLLRTQQDSKSLAKTGLGE